MITTHSKLFYFDSTSTFEFCFFDFHVRNIIFIGNAVVVSTRHKYAQHTLEMLKSFYEVAKPHTNYINKTHLRFILILTFDSMESFCYIFILVNCFYLYNYKCLLTVRILYNNDPSAGSPTETLLRLLLPLNNQVRSTFAKQP